MSSMSCLRTFGFADMLAHANGEDKLFYNLAGVDFNSVVYVSVAFAKFSPFL